MAEQFAGRHVVVTGGAGALGTAVVGALLERGAICHIPCFEADELARFPHAKHARVRATSDVDLTQEPAAEGYFRALPGLWASLHIAGGFSMAPIAETTLNRFRAMIDMNATTCFLCCREAVKRMRLAGAASPGPEGLGRIVNVGARPAVQPAAGMVAYTASKAAVVSITQSLAEEVRAEGILVNAVLPSIMDTPANRKAMPDADHAKWPRAEEVAEAILWLASPENRVTSGAAVPVYGKV